MTGEQSPLDWPGEVDPDDDEVMDVIKVAVVLAVEFGVVQLKLKGEYKFLLDKETRCNEKTDDVTYLKAAAAVQLSACSNFTLIIQVQTILHNGNKNN